MKHWSSHQISTLRRLRDGFLSGEAGAADYWHSAGDLGLYDETFGARIGWKWDAVLRELLARRWRPESRHVFDWGCGSGVASRRVLSAWGKFETLTVHDRSSLAMRFAADRVARDHPHVVIRTGEEAFAESTLLVVSHVLNELSDSGRSALLALARRAHEILWVEAGTHADSRALIAVREELLTPDTTHGLPPFAVVAPCTHQALCGMLVPENAPHWCHHFARAPSAVFQDARWHELSRELGIDLRSLPYSFLVLQRAGRANPTPPGYSRVIGVPRDFKGFSKVLSSQEEGVAEFRLQRRDAPELLRELRAGPELPVYRWLLEGNRIVGAERLDRDDRGS